jgi:hypothetical protein
VAAAGGELGARRSLGQVLNDQGVVGVVVSNANHLQRPLAASGIVSSGSHRHAEERCRARVISLVPAATAVGRRHTKSPLFRRRLAS